MGDDEADCGWFQSLSCILRNLNKPFKHFVSSTQICSKPLNIVGLLFCFICNHAYFAIGYRSRVVREKLLNFLQCPTFGFRQYYVQYAQSGKHHKIEICKGSQYALL